jgi:hypothetical protein
LFFSAEYSSGEKTKVGINGEPLVYIIDAKAPAVLVELVCWMHNHVFFVF